ncbi:DUF2218 domain-containing protein [Streptacidiphilus fuscans]|uniref:DUF2218 domain-containing protein n=1 Tax=Streptacidiphilus fuscans TaxID=2789292 RepID=A0A931AXN0_9ACTN|nr:DUF2218 domain-containing protein [Streptacidiphilus fuscans]MBF9066448.1 DUF2218 domain-containing protein [Streptacidiphilus fuscans]
MPTAEARLATERASRYLVQLCRHLSQMARMSHRPRGGHDADRMPPAVQHVDWTDTHGTVRFAHGQWTLEATPDQLTLRVDAGDEEALQRLQDGITARIEKIGRRDGLQVHWQRAETGDLPPTEPTEPTDETSPTPEKGRASRRPRGTTLGLMAGGAAVVAVHLGIAGAALAGAAWTGWAANAVLVLIVVKLLFMGGHLFLGRAALRRGITLRHGRKQEAPPGADAAG